MELFPAIDLFDRKAVRLLHGDYKQMTVYNDQPIRVAEDFAACGARWIHMVDLEGAKRGDTPNLSVVKAVAENTDLKIEVGGGIRSEDTIKRYLDAGVQRVILGTAAVTNPDFLEKMVSCYGDRIAVSVDIKGEAVAIHGWTQTSELTCDGFMAKLDSLGVSTVICTDISKDGAMKGTNHALYRHLKQTYKLNVIASGGVSSIEDVQKLSDAGLYGAIIGKAYYTGAIDLAEAVRLYGGKA